ncbi:MAG: energy transducer TonB [Thiohalomonadales bacterium]
MNTASLNIIDGMPRYNRINHKDRFSLMMFFALAFHAVIILGISFDAVDEEALYKALTLDVTLVSSKSKEAPEDADYLAQENQLGGGNTEEKVQPSSPFSNPNQNNDNNVAPNTRQEFAPPKQEKVDRKLDMLTVDNDRGKLKKQAMVDPLPIESKKDKPSIKLLNSSQIADLTSRISKQIEQHTNKIKELRSGVSAKEHNTAFYDSAWQDKVVQVGNINYPHAAVKNKITGNVTLEVQIKADGTVFNVIVLKSSGHKILDAAASNIVYLAAPFAALPPEILQDTSIYSIVRVWRFKTGKSIF